MSDILPLLRDLLLSQRESAELIPVPAGLMDQAEKQLTEFEGRYKSGDESVMNLHEAISTVLDEIQEERAEKIWDMAYTQADPVKALTEEERFIFIILSENAAKLRGIS